MKNLFAYDFTNHTIVATKATLKKASNPTTDEYKTLIKMIEGQPTFRVVEKTIKNSGNKKTYKGLTLKMMIRHYVMRGYSINDETKRFTNDPIDEVFRVYDIIIREESEGRYPVC